MSIKLKNPALAAGIFAGWQETLIWSCLQGTMGHIYIPETQEPVAELTENASAAAVLGDFAFFAGEASQRLLQDYPVWCDRDTMILVPKTEQWAQQMEETFGERVQKRSRYAIKKEKDIFNRKKLLAAAASLPEGYEMSLMGRELYELCRKTGWCRDFVSQYDTYDSYEKKGLGVMVRSAGALVAGASSYSSYEGGIEIEIDTREEYRRQGLAYACGARLILECLDRGWYPSWDAHNWASVKLAEKLGYHFDHEYVAYEFTR